MMVRASAPGKVFLIGEHAVVYGKPAILASIDRRIVTEAEDSDVIEVMDHVMMTDPVSIPLDRMLQIRDEIRTIWRSGSENRDFSELFSYFHGDNYKLKIAIIAEALDAFDLEGGVRLNITSNIPHASGLGSSAALAVSMAQAIATLNDIDASTETISDIAYKAEQFVHGTPSGADNTTCAFGGLVWFVKGEPNTINSLKKEIPYELENFGLVYIRQPELRSGELVQKVRNLPEAFRNVRLSRIEQATLRMRDSLRKRDFGAVKECMNSAQKNLRELGVSVKEMDDVARKVMSAGGGAKLCGAGGGGMMLVYHDDKALLKKEINSLGYELIDVKLGGPGVTVE
jgi:mevalonate kinase